MMNAMHCVPAPFYAASAEDGRIAPSHPRELRKRSAEEARPGNNLISMFF